jgi:hypothetical protein
MRASERCVSVRDVRGRLEWLLVEQDFLAVRQKETYLPIGVIQIDRDRGVVLVEFPHEAATGGNRVWARSCDLIETNESRRCVAAAGMLGEPA